jgi:hypothetical protein
MTNFVSATGVAGAATLTGVAVSGTNRVLYAFVSQDVNTDINYTSVVFNTSETMTFLFEEFNAGMYQAVYRLINPSVATASIVVTGGGAGASTNIVSLCVDDAHQTAPEPTLVAGTHSEESAASTAFSGLTITTATGDLLVSSITVNNRNVNFATASGTGQTEHVDIGNAGLGCALSTSTGTGAGVQPVWGTWGSSVATHIAFPILSAAGGTPAPVITDVDEDNTITLEQANVEIDGTDFDDNVVEIRQGGFDYTPSVDSNTATAIVFDMAAVGATGPVTAPHAGSATVAVINVDLQEDTQAVTISNRSGANTLLIGTPNADPDLRLDSTTDAVAGDYVMWFGVVGGAIGDVTVNDDLTFEVTAGVTSFDFQIWDSGDGTWGDAATQTIEVVDEVPDAFSFSDATNQPLSTVVTSDSVVPAGYDSAAISVAGTAGTPEYSINNGAFTAAAGTITAGDGVRVRGTSSGSNSTGLTVVLTIGGVSDTFTITTLALSSGTSKYMSMMGVG